MTKDFTHAERRILSRLTTPQKLQNFLDDLKYNPGNGMPRCPLNVLRDRKAHCFEGAVFAAAVMKEMGFPPLLINMYPQPGTDDEHLLVVYRKYGAWGAVSKSNYVGLRSREPIHRNLRELLISYFEGYYNLKKAKTLRSYTRPLNLNMFENTPWLTNNEMMDVIGDKLDTLPRIPLLTPAMVRGLSRVDRRAYKLGIFGKS